MDLEPSHAPHRRRLICPGSSPPQSPPPPRPHPIPSVSAVRSLIAQYPQLQTGHHLIFVQYEPGHLLHDEWVFNSSDPQHSTIIWLRALGKSADTPVIQYFHDRQPWLLNVDKTQLHFNRYP